MFKNYAPHVRLAYVIDGDLIVIGNTTWQTKNITSVSIAQQKILMRAVEPMFAIPKPVRDLRLGLLALAIGFSWIWALSFERPSYVGWPLTIIFSFSAWFVGSYSQKNHLNLWNQRRENTRRERDVWEILAKKTPDVFSLVIDSSSGKSVALTTLDIEAINTVHAHILTAMRSTSAVAMKGVIETITLSSGSPDDLYEKFCDREISRA